MKQIAGLYILYSICRILFYLFNLTSFQQMELGEFFKILFYGLRFDSFSIAASNSLYILLFLLPFPFYYSKQYQNLLKTIFVLINAFFVMLNFIDFAYFPFNQRRSTIQLFKFIFGNQINILELIPHFIEEYWYIIILYLFIIWLLYKYYELTLNKLKPKIYSYSFNNIGIYVSIFILFNSLTILGIRGGWQKIPIVLLDAAQYTKQQYIPIVLNTPFSLLKSTELSEMKPLNLIPNEKADTYFSPIHKAEISTFKNINVCVIILESFSKEFTNIGNRKSYTPFLDSLMRKSLVFTNAYANGKTSMDGIPSILASLPPLMQNPYINSAYSNNKIETLANLLKTKGYHTTFFHGGTNGTMNFNSFAEIAGFENYYGRTEYNNENDYDGQWGIWDDAFLRKVPGVISTNKEPFFASIFTLSSHNPYLVPDNFKGRFPKGNQDILESLGYTDYSLSVFFNECKKQPWYNNTLFVITSDHSAESYDEFYSNVIGQYSIPIIIFKNDELNGKSNKTVQQIDILPTILDYLNYDKSYYAFGQSMFSLEKKPAIWFISPNYYVQQDSLLYIYNSQYFLEAYNVVQDSLLTKNIFGKNKKRDNEILNFTQSFIQRYINDMINNKTHCK